MAVTVNSVIGTNAVKVVTNTDCDETADNNVLPGAGNLQMVEIDNTGNASAGFYLQLYNHAAPTAGTTEPEMVLTCAAGANAQYVFPRNIVFGTAISMMGSTNLAAPAYTPAGPSAAVTVKLITAS